MEEAKTWGLWDGLQENIEIIIRHCRDTGKSDAAAAEEITRQMKAMVFHVFELGIGDV